MCFGTILLVYISCARHKLIGFQSHDTLHITVAIRDFHIFKESPYVALRQLHKSLQHEVTLSYLGKLSHSDK